MENAPDTAGRVGSGGVIAFTKCLAREVARYMINISCVCRGPTAARMLAT